MLSVHATPGSDVVEIAFEGVPDADALRRAHDALSAAVHEHGSIRLFARYGHIDLSHMGPAAFWEDLKNLPLVPRISRCALVADQAWVRRLTSVVAPILPCEVRSWPHGEDAEARAWLDSGEEG